MKSSNLPPISSDAQYYEYCNLLEQIVTDENKRREQQDTVDLLTTLIEKWDQEHNTFPDVDPIEMLGYLMKENKLTAVDLARELGVSNSLLSNIIHHRRGLSKDIVHKLSNRFKVSKELFKKVQAK